MCAAARRAPRDRPARSVVPRRSRRCDLSQRRLGLRPRRRRRRHALAARARPRRAGRRRGRADRADRHPVRPAERRRQAVGLAALSRARPMPATGNAARDFALGNAGAGLGAKAGNLKGGLGSGLGGRSRDRPAGRRAGGGQCARLHDDGRHAAVLGLGAGAGQRVRRPAAAAARAVAGGERTTAPTSATIPPTPRAAIRAPTPPSPSSPPMPGSTRPSAKRLAMMAQDGLARSIRPVHTPQDGDTVFAVATGTPRPRSSII